MVESLGCGKCLILLGAILCILGSTISGGSASSFLSRQVEMGMKAKKDEALSFLYSNIYI